MARPAREQRPAPADGIPASRTGGGPHAGPAARAGKATVDAALPCLESTPGGGRQPRARLPGWAPCST